MRDDSEFDSFYTATVRRVVIEVYAMVGNLHEAEDAVQEAYARAWHRWRRICGYSDPAGWVRTVAYRIAVSSWRRARNRRHAHARVATPESSTEISADTVALAEALRGLPMAQRQAIVLYHLVGLSVVEIAAETGASVSAVKARLSRGRQALAVMLASHDGPSEVVRGDR
jgi:RNA polymerase sigma-70 factor (ECF subfamily)